MGTRLRRPTKFNWFKGLDIAPPLACRGQWFYVLERFAESILLYLKVVMALKVQPEPFSSSRSNERDAVPYQR